MGGGKKEYSLDAGTLVGMVAGRRGLSFLAYLILSIKSEAKSSEERGELQAGHGKRRESNSAYCALARLEVCWERFAGAHSSHPPNGSDSEVSAFLSPFFR